MFRFDPYSPAIDADPFPAYRTLRDEPLLLEPAGGHLGAVALCRHRQAGQDWQTYSSARAT
jgi:hypothetical protein